LNLEELFCLSKTAFVVRIYFLEFSKGIFIGGIEIYREFQGAE
jgi:hypothetical protein